MTEEFAVDVWYRNEEKYTIEADSPEEAIDKAEKRFWEIGSGRLDSLTVTGTVDGRRETPLDGGPVRRFKGE